MDDYTRTSSGRVQKVKIKVDEVKLGDFIESDEIWYEIEAIYKYRDIEEDESYWIDFTGISSSGERVYISADMNEEYIWEYTIWDIVSKKELRENEVLMEIGSGGHKKKISYNDINYKVWDKEDMLYEAQVESYVKGRDKNPIYYPVLISDLENEDGDKFLSIEIDEDELVEVSIGKYIDSIELIKGEREEEKNFLSKMKKIIFGK